MSIAALTAQTNETRKGKQMGRVVWISGKEQSSGTYRTDSSCSENVQKLQDPRYSSQTCIKTISCIEKAVIQEGSNGTLQHKDGTQYGTGSWFWMSLLERKTE